MIFSVSYEEHTGSEVRRAGTAAEDRLPLRPREGVMRRKATDGAASLALGCSPHGAAAVIRRRLAERWSWVGEEFPCRCAPQMRSAGFFASR